MLRKMTAVAALALAASSPAFSDPGGHDGGKGKGGGQAHSKGKNHGGKNRGGDHARHAGRAPDKAFQQGAMNDRRDDGMRNASGNRDTVMVRVRNDDPRITDREWNRDGDRLDAARDCPPGLAKKDNGCMPPGLARQRDARFGADFYDIDPRERLRVIDYRPAFFGFGDRYRGDYVYRDGYLVAPGATRVMIPLLGGALAVGQLWPSGYESRPLAEWQNRYYGFDGPDYRYVDNVIYRVDPQSAAIQSVAALLTGSDFVIGQRVPLGYDVYNVPTAYRSQYADSDDALYRYSDGRIYEIDPVTMLVAKAIDAVL